MLFEKIKRKTLDTAPYKYIQEGQYCTLHMFTRVSCPVQYLENKVKIVSEYSYHLRYLLDIPDGQDSTRARPYWRTCSTVHQLSTTGRIWEVSFVPSLWHIQHPPWTLPGGLRGGCWYMADYAIGLHHMFRYRRITDDLTSVIYQIWLSLFIRSEFHYLSQNPDSFR